MDKRMEKMKSTTEYNELNEVIRKKTKNDVRHHNTQLIKTLIENNKIMKLFKTINTRGRLKKHQFDISTIHYIKKGFRNH